MSLGICHLCIYVYLRVFVYIVCWCGKCREGGASQRNVHIRCHLCNWRRASLQRKSLTHLFSLTKVCPLLMAHEKAIRQTCNEKVIESFYDFHSKKMPGLLIVDPWYHYICQSLHYCGDHHHGPLHPHHHHHHHHPHHDHLRHLHQHNASNAVVTGFPYATLSSLTCTVHNI